jgi:hypothetical protein
MRTLIPNPACSSACSGGCHDSIAHDRQTELACYFALVTLIGHLAWEAAQIPLYTIWVEGTWGEITLAVLHCTGGDVLIAMSSLLLVLFVFGSGAWPRERVIPVLIATIISGVGLPRYYAGHSYYRCGPDCGPAMGGRSRTGLSCCC